MKMIVTTIQITVVSAYDETCYGMSAAEAAQSVEDTISYAYRKVDVGQVMDEQLLAPHNVFSAEQSHIASVVYGSEHVSK